ncbi:hypothetical protein [Pontibacter roseus]|uniref:hypothetical protein n=1 Tax=Pontibacter roseus TaxID=336989 RepID=UPI00036A769D|nr:hypothetical protein [Pontibacter roseus]
MKTGAILLFAVLLSMSGIALGQDVRISLNDPLSSERYSLLSYDGNIELVGSRDTLAPAALSTEELKELSKLIAEQIVKENRAIEPEVNGMVRKSPQHAEMLEKSTYLFEAASYYYQLLPVMGNNGQKMVWINAIHHSLVKEEPDKHTVILIADGRNLYFNFWAYLPGQEKEK